MNLIYRAKRVHITPLLVLLMSLGTAVYAQALPNWLEKQVRSGSLTREEAIQLNQGVSKSKGKTEPIPSPTETPTAFSAAEEDIAKAKKYFERGTDRKEHGDLQGAVEDLTEAIRLNPKYAEAYSRRCGTLINAREYNLARQDCQKAIKLNPRYPIAHYNRGLIYEELEKDKKAAIAEYSEVIRLDKNYGYAFLNRGSLRQGLGDLKGAIEDYTQAINVKQDESCSACAYYNRGYARSDQNNYAEAERDYNEALKLEPNFAIALEDRGWVRWRLGNMAGSKADYQKAAAIYKKEGDTERYQRAQDILHKSFAPGP